MKKEITVTGKTVEEALNRAVEELGAPSVNEIQYTVVTEPKRGLFGIGAVPAKITATYEKSGEETALAFVRQLMSNMGLDVTIRMSDGDNDDKRIDIDGDCAGVLIGHHGETLDSLQYLANLAANRKEEDEKRDYVKITLDVGGYRAKREETLRILARRMAERVLRFKKSVMLEPMNPYERRIIHSEVQKIDGVSTNSIGSENNRKIVIYLENQPTGAASAPAAKTAFAPKVSVTPVAAPAVKAPEVADAVVDDRFADDGQPDSAFIEPEDNQD